MLQSARDRGVNVKYKSPLDVLIKILKADGIKGLYRGNVGTLCREIPGNIAWFGVYNIVTSSFLKPGQTKDDLKAWQTMLAGSCSGFSYWTIFFPADNVKSRLQTDLSAKGKKFLDVFKMVYKTEGIRGLYRGWMITAIRASYSHAFVFLIYTRAVKLFNIIDP